MEQFLPNLAPAPPPNRKVWLQTLLKAFGITSVITALLTVGLTSWTSMISSTTSASTTIGLVFATIALLMGSFFFLYSLKYYMTLALVLSFSQQGEKLKADKKHKSFMDWILGTNTISGKEVHTSPSQGTLGLEATEHIILKRHPFISIHVPLYNEKRVVERITHACSNFDYEGEYELILCDDSTDETTKIIKDYLHKLQTSKYPKLQTTKGDGWTLTTAEVRPGVSLKHLHRTSRLGYKGGALKLALTLVNPKTEFISVFDADFVPYPDTLYLFLKYFKVQNDMNEDYAKSNVAAVQGYQWHVLNKSENWITRGVRSEYSGSYVIERSGSEIYRGLKQISGAVYMIRRDVLEKVGWETSITEDFQLTLKLYDAGYKVVYTPYIQAPAECVSTLKRLIRQRMRWAEGHSFNIKKCLVG